MGEDDMDIPTVNDTFEEEVSMYINDCAQYLRAFAEDSEVNMNRMEFNPTKDREKIILGLRKLKDICIQLSGGSPLDWSEQLEKKAQRGHTD